MNSTRINTDVFDPDNIDGSYTNQIKENETLQQDDSLKNSEKTGQLKKRSRQQKHQQPKRKNKDGYPVFSTIGAPVYL